MERQVIWTAPAVENLKVIRSYIARDNPIAATSFGLELFKSTRNLGRFPLSGRVFHEDEEGQVRELIYRGYRIFYQERGAIVEVLHVRHGARGEPNLRFK